MLSPGVGYQPGRRCRPRDMLDSLSAATPSPATHLPSPLTDLPSPRIQCCNHILLCGHNQLLGSRGKFQGGKFELPNILLSPKGKRRGKWKGPRPSLHRTLWELPESSLHWVTQGTCDFPQHQAVRTHEVSQQEDHRGQHPRFLGGWSCGNSARHIRKHGR